MQKQRWQTKKGQRYSMTESEGPSIFASGFRQLRLAMGNLIDDHLQSIVSLKIIMGLCRTEYILI